MRKLLFFLTIIIFLSCSNSNTTKPNRTLDEVDSALPKKNVSQKKGLSSTKTVTNKFPSINLDFLFLKENSDVLISENQRNIVQMEEDPEVVAERKRKEEELRKQAEDAAKRAEEERRKKEEELKLNPPPPQPPPINFQFIGYMGPPGKRIGIFKMIGTDNDLILKRKGEKILEDFIIVDIGYESAEIGFEGFTETKTISLVSGGN